MSFQFGDNPKPKPPPVSRSVIFLSLLFLIIGYYAWDTGKLTISSLILLIVIIPSVILHEISHGWLAYKFGDSTAKNAGRLTLNPLRHFDTFGTFILPVILILTSGFAFGHAKPVPVNTHGMSRNKSMFVGLIGPATNIAIALFAGMAMRIMSGYITSVEVDSIFGLVFEFLLLCGITNIGLAVFNMIPIPPLDGSAVIERFLPQKYMLGYLKFRQYSMVILIFIMLILYSSDKSLGFLIEPFIKLWLTLFGFEFLY